MAGDLTKAVSDPQFWKELNVAFQTAPFRARDWAKKLAAIPRQADRIAEDRFPDSARDASTKNAFRHALGTGMVTRKLGGGPISAAMAQAAGYGWEALGAKEFLTDAEHRDDTLHDLNANYIGAQTATEAKNQDDLVRQLDFLARQAEKRPAPPPGGYAPDHRTMTRSVQ